MRSFIFSIPPQHAHEQTLRFLAWLDARDWAQIPLRWLHDTAFVERPIHVGGVTLHHPLIVAAGYIKGEGFSDERTALAAVERNIIPGWRSLPTLVGAVEFGSFTRHPRLGNSGVVLWRDEMTRSTQNRVGLKNPGAIAAAEFLTARRDYLPPIFGLNIATSPGISDPAQDCRDVLEAITTFIERGVRPTWFTLNLSCPNTEDDPGGRQTEARAHDLCAAVTAYLQPHAIPLWVKISPDLAMEQYHALLRAFHETGVRAIVTTNTLAAPAPDNSTAGIGGGRLHLHALNVVTLLTAEIAMQGYQIDVIACGGVENGVTFRAFAECGVKAMQYWSALVYRGPLTAALIDKESRI